MEKQECITSQRPVKKSLKEDDFVVRQAKAAGRRTEKHRGNTRNVTGHRRAPANGDTKE